MSPLIGGSSVASGGLEHRRARVEQRPQLGDRRLALLVGVVQLDELLDRLEELGEVEDERRQLTDGELRVLIRAQNPSAEW